MVILDGWFGAGHGRFSAGPDRTHSEATDPGQEPGAVRDCGFTVAVVAAQLLSPLAGRMARISLCSHEDSHHLAGSTPTPCHTS
jgi:hypothetical protein